MKASHRVMVAVAVALSLAVAEHGSAGEPAPGAPQAPRPPAVAADAVTALLEAFESHPLVALGEGQHWNEQSHAFRLSLLRDPRFADRVNDIVVEFGSSRYQDVIDRFVAGADVPYAELRQVWENTTAPNTVWDMPIYEEFFRAVRDVNLKLLPSRRLRVLLGDPPIDWAKVASKEEILDWMAKRDTFAAEVVRREVLEKKRHALVVYGDGHLFRAAPEPTLVSLLEKEAPGSLYSITTPTTADLPAIQADVAKWRAPAIALLRGTVLGAAPLVAVYGEQGPAWDSLKMETQFSTPFSTSGRRRA